MLLHLVLSCCGAGLQEPQPVKGALAVVLHRWALVETSVHSSGQLVIILRELPLPPFLPLFFFLLSPPSSAVQIYIT